jgi:hypothetical protein
MAKQRTKTRMSKIAFLSGCFFILALVVSFMAGASLYMQEHPKQKLYKEDLCRVRDTSFNTVQHCSLESKYLGKRCYIPVWEVNYSQNGTKRAIIKGLPEKFYLAAASKIKEYEVSITSNISSSAKIKDQL